MRGKDNNRTAAEVLVDQLRIHGVAARVLRAGRKLSRRDRCVSRQRYRRHRLPAGGRRRDDGGGGGQGDRPPGRLFRHPRARRHQRFARHPHRPPGFDAARRVRRPGRARHDRARSVSGTRLPRRVRLDDQMGDRDRRSGARAGNRVTRVPHRRQRTAGPGGRQLARRHADRAHRRRRRAAVYADRDLAGRRPRWRSSRSCSAPRARRS